MGGVLSHDLLGFIWWHYWRTTFWKAEAMVIYPTFTAANHLWFFRRRYYAHAKSYGKGFAMLIASIRGPFI